MMETPWRHSGPAGGPADVNLDRFDSLLELFDDAFRRFGPREAFVCMGGALTYAQLESASARFAGWLQSLGLARGSRVALMLPNVLQYPVALIGTLRAGCTVVNVNPLYTARELSHQLVDSGAEVIIILENFAATLQKVIAQTAVRHVAVTSLGEMLGARGWLVDFVVRRVRKLVPPWSLPGHLSMSAALGAGARHGFARVQVTRDDIAVLQYTGGTTGVAKGAMLLHRNLVANTLQCEALLVPVLRDRGDAPVTVLAALPLYHIFALTVCGLMSIRTGSKAILIPNPRDLDGLVKTLAASPVHIFPAVNTLFNALLNHPGIDRIDFSSLLVAIAGGMAAQDAVARRWFARTGRVLLEGYGLTETSPLVSVTPPDATAFTGTVGWPVHATEVSIRDEAGRPLANGEIGEICIRGPQVMAGYWRRPDETAKALTSDGWFRSGDIGYRTPEGSLKLVDRKKDMILVSGFNVYPNEVEGVAAAHPGVREVAAVGVDDERTGEAVKLFVVRSDPTLTEDALKAFCRERLAAYKAPRIVEFRDELPKTNVGKILRRALRDKVAVVPEASDAQPVL